MEQFMQCMTQRRSVRTFDNKGISAETLQQLREYADALQNPFGVKVTFKFASTEEYGLSSPVIVGEKYYILAIAPKCARMEEAVGYSFEQLLLYAWSLGLGSVWIGGTMDRKLFEKAADLKEGERMPCVSPIGVAAPKMSTREKLMRKGIKADTRGAWNELFFEKDFSTPLKKEAVETIAPVLEMVRLAPSAVNRQPWRLVVQGDRVHFYEKPYKGMVSDAVGDMQRIDIGIAINHFMLALAQSGMQADILDEEPPVEKPAGLQYVITIKIEK